MLEQFRHRALVWWSGVISRRPWTIVLIATALALGSIALSVHRWHFESNRNALIDDDLDWNQRFIRWTRSFAGTTDLTVVIDTQPPGATAKDAKEQQRLARRLADDLGEALEKLPSVQSAVWRFETTRASPRTIRMLPMAEFEQRLNELSQAGPVFESPTPADLVGRIIREMMRGQSETDAGHGEEALASAGQQLRELTAFISAIAGVIQGPDGPNRFLTLASDGDADLKATEYEYLASDNNRLLFMRITPRVNADSNTLTALSDSIDAIRATIKAVSEQYPTIEAGLTGIEAIENDETMAVTRDSTIASIIAVVLIAITLVLAFHSFRTPLLAVGSLLYGVAWSFGFLYLSVGHLQVLSVFFTVMLLGLGIAFGIHLVTRFELVRHQYPDTIEGFAQALDDSFETMGPGIVTGAITTSAAFATTMFTDFRGVAEMGLIASVGILLCLTAMFSVFPAMLRIFKPLHRHVVPMEDRRLHLFEERWCMPFVRRPRVTIAIAFLTTAASFAAITRMHFNYNLEELLPTGVDSVMWQRRIVESGTSIYSAASISNSLDEARARAEQFRQLKSVAEVRGIGLLFPPDDQQKLAMIAEARAKLGGAIERALADAQPTTPPGAELRNQLRLLSSLARQFAASIPPELKPQIERLSAAADRALAELDKLSDEQQKSRLARMQRDYVAWRKWLASAFEPGPLTPQDLPAELMRPYVNSEGRYALDVVPDPTLGGSQSIRSPLDPAFLYRFIHDMESVDPQVTGVIVQYFKSGKLIKDSYQMAGLIALAIVFTFVWIDFRSVGQAALTLVPVAAGFAVTFGVMHLLDMQINPANIIVLPLMFGIGVDAGVHIIHRYRQDPESRPLGLTSGTGKGITITSLTTMIGFGSMMIASHRGIWSLGFVMTTGIGLTLLACWSVMPATLELNGKRRPDKTTGA